MRPLLFILTALIHFGCDRSKTEAANPSEDTEPTSQAVAILSPLIDPDKLDTLTGKRAATPRLRKACYWVHVAEQEGHDPAQSVPSSTTAFSIWSSCLTPSTRGRALRSETVKGASPADGINPDFSARRDWKQWPERADNYGNQIADTVRSRIRAESAQYVKRLDRCVQKSVAHFLPVHLCIALHLSSNQDLKPSEASKKKKPSSH